MNWAYWLFSQMKMTGSSFTAQKFIASWTVPLLIPPSPKKQTATWSEPLYLIDIAAPVAITVPAATMPFAPSTPLEKSATCMEPPRPLQPPVTFPYNSAISPLISTPLAMA